MPSNENAIELINGFLKAANADLEKDAAANLDLAGDAKSTHPSANVDDKTKPATEGARSAENEADVKKDVPNTIDDASADNKGGTEGATVSGDQGTVTMAADSGLKGNVDTPKKDHSQSMSDAGPGDGSESFSGDWDKASAAAALTGEANALLADVAMLGGVTPKTPAQPNAQQPEAAKSASDEEAAELFKKAAEQYPADVESGYVAASLLAQNMGLMGKDASAGADETTLAVAEIQKAAAVDADNYADYLTGFAEAMQKGAMPMGADPAALAALAGEGDAGGELGAEEMAAGAGEEGAGEEEAALGAGEEELGAEAMGGEGEVGGEGEGGDALAQLAMVLEQAGIDPQELAEAVAAQSAGGEGGGEEEAGMVAPEAVV